MKQPLQHALGRLVLLAALSLVIPSVAEASRAEPPEKPDFGIPKGQLAGKFRRIAFGPRSLGRTKNAGLDSVRAVMESLFVGRLRSVGFEVVEPRVSEEVFRQLADSLGGVIDQPRGSYNPDHAAMAQIQTIVALHERYKADGLLYWAVQEWGPESHDFLTVRIDDGDGNQVYEYLVELGPRQPVIEIVKDRRRCAAAVKAVLSPFCKATLRR